MAVAKNKTKTERVLKSETFFILDEETEFLCSNKDVKRSALISNKSQFDSVLNNNVEAKNLIILVELGWHNTVSKFYGYEVAKDLLGIWRSKFNLAFISTFPRQTLLQLNSGKNRVFTQRFPHYEITNGFDLTKISLPEISERKFDYLKNYCLLETGILDRLEHDIRPLLSNPEPEKLQRLIADLISNRDILSNEIVAKAHRIAELENEDIKLILFDIHGLLQELQKKFKKPEEFIGKKSDSRVMLIEDDALTLNKLHNQFSKYFNMIKTFGTGTEAYNELYPEGKNNAYAYDVVITDMELLQGDFDDDKLGVDILELCEQKFPFLVTRVITSLPRNALQQLIGRNFGKKLNEIIYKSYSSENIIPPFENLIEFVQQIDKEVKQRMSLRNMKGPVSSWWGKHLTRQLYLTQIQNPEEFFSIWDNVSKAATKFINGDFDTLRDDEKLAVEFVQLKEVSNNPGSGWKIIELLLIHRSIALWFAAKHCWNEFYYSGNGADVYINLQGFQSAIDSKSSKTYFNTILGLSAPGASDKREERLKCKLLPKNLFPEEIEWLKKSISTSLDPIPLCDIRGCEDFHPGFLRFITEYNNPSISEDVTYGETLQMLKEFFENFQDEKDIQKNNHLKQIFETKMMESSGALPSELKALIEKIKEEVFYL